MNEFKNRLFLIPIATAALLVVSACSTLRHSSSAALQGTWTGREIGVTPDTPRVLVISGSHIEYRGSHEQDWGKGTFSIQEDTQPKQLIVSLMECGFPQYVGKTTVMIFKIENGTLTAAANEPGTIAPADFDTEGTRRMVFTRE